MKITNIPQGKSYVPGVKIAGQYLQNFNFNINDTVIVNCQKNKVVIKKATEKDIFNSCPSLVLRDSHKHFR